jgi:hypothetical protein
MSVQAAYERRRKISISQQKYSGDQPEIADFSSPACPAFATNPQFRPFALKNTPRSVMPGITLSVREEINRIRKRDMPSFKKRYHK